MQPLSRVSPKARVNPSAAIGLNKNPEIAALVAQCIGEWAENEFVLGLVLSLVLGTEAKAARAMYLALSNFNAQIGALEVAARLQLTGETEEFAAALFKLARSAYKHRNKLAHWVWADSPDLPDAMLLIDPQERVESMVAALSGPTSVREFDRSKIYVIRKHDLQAHLDTIRTVGQLGGGLLVLLAPNMPEWLRDQSRQQLSNDPRMVEVLRRLRAHRKKIEATPPPSCATEQSDKD